MVAQQKMARSDLLLNLVRGASGQDSMLFQRSLEALIAEERAKHHHVLADRLEELMLSSLKREPSDLLGDSPQGLYHERVQHVGFDQLILPESVRAACSELVEEHHRVDLLRSYALEPRNRILLVGPPGNGKTSLAAAIANALMVPLVTVRYEGVIGSFLGETATRLQRIFDHVRSRHCVLFFDEFDTVGKERGDIHETGEIKRVVSSLLMQMDDLPSHVLVVTATNHPELLDRAVWRRFQLRLILPKPSSEQVVQWLIRLEDSMGMHLGYSPKTIAQRLGRVSFGELEEFSTDVRRRYVLALPNADIKRIVASRLNQWEARFRLRRRSTPKDKQR